MFKHILWIGHKHLLYIHGIVVLQKDLQSIYVIIPVWTLSQDIIIDIFVTSLNSHIAQKSLNIFPLQIMAGYHLLQHNNKWEHSLNYLTVK